MGCATKPSGACRTVPAATAGTINPITKKAYLDDRYKPRTIRHSNAVLRSFYEFWIDEGAGPLVNPVPLARAEQRRAHAHHNPLEPYRGGGQLRYNPKAPVRRPRQMPDERWSELFAALRSNRDRAIVALAVSNGARASELLGVRGVFRRVNALLVGTNWSMHDLRHTSALRMSRDEALTLRNVQTITGHVHLSTTADIYH